jgi:[DsrC]-trisulfide reductase subunit J
MYDASRILPGLGAFLVLVTYPVWHGVATGQDARAPQLAKPVEATECVQEARQMRRTHMQLLMTWRDEAVRQNRRVYVAASGRQYDKNLTGTCLRCHADKKGFCDRCHQYVQVSPHCWECHVDPKGGW